MKPQQRKFVVEFKSTRRRPKGQAKSIWGNTDFKAIVRETQADAPHLFGPVDPSPQSGPEREHHLPASLAPAEAAAPDHDLTQFKQSDVPAEAAPQFERDAAKPVVRSSRPPREQPKLRHRPVRRASTDFRETPTMAQPGQSDDLIALEDENRRLKALMAEYLRQQNSALRDMLLRF
ncbi:hypothetical protein [Rhizobium grahamii]|uniref:Uncharacterized protein n=1 Tax=Rhizobium grahamii CCGE 502 TaxID=990285 RepID=S3HEH8_9HYPH|nr:hypothetical protein [Rhizobium grahamii]EPE96485.1 hypothetical protein RGCCGE502_20095 [Rhizobium grahamii CCGE 502]